MKLKDLLALGKTRTVILELREITTNNPKLNKEVNLIAARFAEYEQQKTMGLENSSVLMVELNKINIALLSIIEQLDERETFSPIKYNSYLVSEKKLWIYILIAIIGLIAVWGIAKATGNKDKYKPFSVVVYVHGEGGKQDIVQLEETKLIADFGERREVANIGINNQNIFSEIPFLFYNSRIGIGLQGTSGYVLRFPDSTYLLNGEPIYLEVRSICRFCNITGIVRSQNQFIPNAIVNTGRFSDTTDANGYFEINIPPEMEQTEYGVTVRLNNKIVWDNFITPNPKYPAEILINNYGFK